jgi:hypothetical protein
VLREVLLVDRVRSTVPAYEFCDVMVIVDEALLPCATLIFVAAREKVPVEEPVLEPPMVTVVVPLEAA